ncbi:glycosyltransferase family 1 protein [Olivibacter ginsenosidimutans]|uniref:Glycosyltransferase family 1 protein n=1 Tax=Olivibacter ginsenosidimutans TaxID=1176537 RepID=A0ABP9AE67_9SPHI
MKVLIDSRWQGNTGIGRLYQEVMDRKPPEVLDKHIESNVSLGSIFSPWMLAKSIRAADADVFYSPSFMPPLYANIPFVITIHDLMHLFYYSTFHRLYYKRVIAPLAKRAKKIITVSHFSKQQLISLLGIDEQRITVIYNGVDDSFRFNKMAYSLNRPYVLYVGNRRKNKNVPAMLTAFAQAKIPQDVVFALTGQPDEALVQQAKQLGIQERIKFLGFISEEELPKLYKGALATLYVSLMEGFGLPILESMASGTPVLTANTSSLPEIAGTAALCVNPLSVPDITQGITRLVLDPELRQQYIAAGERRVLDFQWEQTAIQTWKTIIHA